MLFYVLLVLKVNTTVLLLLGVPFFSHSEGRVGLLEDRKQSAVEQGEQVRFEWFTSVCHMRSGIQQVEGWWTSQKCGAAKVRYLIGSRVSRVGNRRK